MDNFCFFGAHHLLNLNCTFEPSAVSGVESMSISMTENSNRIVPDPTKLFSPYQNENNLQIELML